MGFPRLIGALFFALATAPVQAQTVYVDQGSSWTQNLRVQYYIQDQGSRIMPIAWMRALNQTDGTPFLDGSLERYGYLPLPGSGESDLPVGFTTNGTGADMAVGMTCSACHTRQIDVNGTNYRIDGGPAIVDFQSFLKDLDDAVLALLADEEVFNDFAEKVLGGGADASSVTALKAQVIIWSNRYHTLIDRSLPDPAWGPARLDAVSMIFNRLTGLDIGPESDDYLIPENIAVADAPTRYPFLWNAAKQDFTQWPGFAENGNDLFGLSRNLGEVYGVFGEFHPQPRSSLLFNRDYVSVNSANWEGLKLLEDWLWDIGAPRWPWELDEALAFQGAAIFNLPAANGGCVECHGKRKGKWRQPFKATYATPILDVGTDQRECQILTRIVKTGSLEGAKIPIVGKRLAAQAPAFEVLATSVLGAIIQHSASFLSDERLAEARGNSESPDQMTDDQLLKEFDELRRAFPIDTDLTESAPGSAGCKYEARVLDGIWAAAPYLHNGSVPSLAELLKKPEDRVTAYTPGPNYDIEAVGMATQQTVFDHEIKLTGCDDNASGNSNCGHPYGTTLSEENKRALLEYLKSI
ncbi:di-heme-cytochrome C peroxidase [uncultured Roseovarius sp.]|uniref:di-heme-cytochrome C peroxidase n=1 Tax=uncultured Roseovarius sp. TaxID=293344 RepID=UPI002635F016|nr:di-heme-cytochrome C peroxidase [uncultured Roseovarius sp.]